MSTPVVVGPCECGGYGVVLDEEHRSTFGRCHVSITSEERIQDDMRDIMEALGLATHARDASLHEVMRREIIPAVRRMAAIAGKEPDHELARLRAQLAASEARALKLERMFRHTHVATGSAMDACAECGFDIRDPIHVRRAARPTESPHAGGEYHGQ